MDHPRSGIGIGEVGASEDLTGIVRNARQQAQAARAEYEAKCAAAGREVDPVLADITYHRELARAEGRIYFAGD